MAEGQSRFITGSPADVKLFLKGPDGRVYGKNPAYLHSKILKRIKSFESKLSNRSEPQKYIEIWVTTSHNFDHYLKCIEIMYGVHVDFPSIMECLVILSVASQISADECINKCLRYLETVRWSLEEEFQIRRVLSCEKLSPRFSPDLTARLRREDDDNHMNFVEKSIQEMVSLITSGDLSLSANRERVEKYFEKVLQEDISRDVVEVCGRVLLQEFKASLDSRDFSTLKLIFNLIQHCKGEILEAALKVFCEEAEFAKHVKDNSLFDGIAQPVFKVVMWFIKATGEGKILISRASRVSLLTTWLPIMGKLVGCNNSVGDKSEELDKAVLKVFESLPPVDQRRICLLWTQVYIFNKIDIATPLTLAQHLQHVHFKP